VGLGILIWPLLLPVDLNFNGARHSLAGQAEIVMPT
jgi:hypothetical protein